MLNGNAPDEADWMDEVSPAADAGFEKPACAEEGGAGAVKNPPGRGADGWV